MSPSPSTCACAMRNPLRNPQGQFALRSAIRSPCATRRGAERFDLALCSCAPCPGCRGCLTSHSALDCHRLQSPNGFRLIPTHSELFRLIPSRPSAPSGPFTIRPLTSPRPPRPPCSSCPPCPQRHPERLPCASNSTAYCTIQRLPCASSLSWPPVMIGTSPSRPPSRVAWPAPSAV